MSWDRVVIASASAGESLLPHIAALFAQQRATWPAFCAGEAALEQLQSKRLTAERATIAVQVNPARRRSIHAKVDAQSIAARPCFLCPENMPAEERGVALGDLVVLPNPYPILPRHCTVADRRHVPQQLAGNVGRMLALAAAVGPDLAVFYNGPQCGASAPDHLHFQACDAAAIPALDELPPVEDLAPQRIALLNFGRAIMLFTSQHAEEVRRDLEQALAELASLQGSTDEPLVNVVVHRRENRYVALLFPRRAHRPQRYFAAGAERLAISPAALEMAGVLVAAELQDFDRLDASLAREVYEEVSLDRAQFSELGDRLGLIERRTSSGE